MCFSLQRRAIFRHRNFKKWSAPEVFCTFSLENVLLATAACNFSTSQLPKVLRDRQFFTILTWKCASRHSGVQFFHIATSKSGPPMRCFVHFDLKMCFSLQRRAIFPHRYFQKWSEPGVLCRFWLNMCFSLQRRAIFRHRNFKKCSETVSFLTFWLGNVLLATAACNFSTSQLQKVVWECQFFSIFTSKCASRYSGVQFFDIATSKSGPPLRCFVHFHLKMCFAPQRRAIFPHLNFQKCSETVSFLRFWLENVLLATAACNFSTSQLQKVVRPWGVLYILTWKCASRYSGVQFFHIATSKSGPNLVCFVDFDWTCASRYSGVQFFMSSLNSHLRTRRFTEVTFRPSPPTNHWKTQHFATSLTLRACGSSFYWLSRNCIFFLLLCSAFSTVHIVGS